MTTSEAGKGTSGRRQADDDPIETREWLDSIEAIVRYRGPERALFLLQKMESQLRDQGVSALQPPYSAYRNTIPLEKQGAYPGDLARRGAHHLDHPLERARHGRARQPRLTASSAATSRATPRRRKSSRRVSITFSRRPRGLWRRSRLLPAALGARRLRARLPRGPPRARTTLARYRQEVGGGGLSSYPHPWLMPDFWQFPTGSMGLGVINAIYQARFMRYLENRGLLTRSDRRVWGVYGDGEIDEPESTAALTLAAREKLDNLTFIVNCNLQRLDGPVRGNGQIIQELESLFTGAGWNVIKVLWGSDWDALFARDKRHVLLRRFAETVDGEYQNLGAHDGDYNRDEVLPDQDPDSSALVETMTDAEINALKRGGHDFRKLYAAFAAARAHKGRPTVILAKTKKGFGMGAAGESRMTAHQSKKLDVDALLAFRDRFGLPLSSDEDAAALAFYRPPRRQPGNALPPRAPRGARRLSSRAAAPGGRRLRRFRRSSLRGFATAAGGKEMSTTMAAVRMLGALLKDRQIGPRIVPIVADEARTFGMASLFRQIGIYAPQGQLYEPEDAGSMLSYREAKDGQLLEEGITEAGALSSWTAAATSYSVHGLTDAAVLYLLFDVRLSAGRRPDLGGRRPARARIPARRNRRPHDARGRGPAASGRRQPRHGGLDPRTAAPTIRAFAYELAVIIDHGMRRMIESPDRRILLPHRNERELRAALDAGGRRSRHRRGALSGRRHARRRLRSARTAARLGSDPARVDRGGGDAGRGLGRRERCVQRDELQRARARGGRSRAAEPPASRRDAPRVSHVEKLLAGRAPIVAASDYVRAYPSSSRLMSRRASWRWEPTASDAATRGRNCADSSRSTGATSRWRRFTRSPKRERSGTAP